MKIHVRVDDYPYGTPWDKEKYDPIAADRKISLLNEIGPCMIGCVLEEMTGHEWNQIEHTQLIPCFHGFSHGLEKWRPTSEGGGEFEGQNYYELKLKFKKHLHTLIRFNIDICVPPFNSYTQTLLDCLNEFEFKYLSGGAEVPLFGFDKLNHGNVKLKLPDFYPKYGEYVAEGDYVDHILSRQFEINEGSTLCVHFPFDKIDLLCKFIKQQNLQVVPYA